MLNNKREEVLTDYLPTLNDNLDVVPDCTSAPLMYIRNYINTKPDICVLDVFSCSRGWCCCCCICREEPELPPVLSKQWQEGRAALHKVQKALKSAFPPSVSILLSLTLVMFCGSHPESG